ncbi:MAG TPA: hypothetical protein VNT81_08645 [Vicinamibacterales bacterium]|nr:hypothetical protein [Vicinamibacterales bacterium]
MMTFESIVIGCCDRFISQRTFELVVAPALADLDFEQDSGRCSLLAARSSVLWALAGALRHDIGRGSADFFKLSLLSFCYFVFPIALGIRYFETWSDFAIAATFVLAMSLVPVMVCFWPSRQSVRPNE